MSEDQVRAPSIPDGPALPAWLYPGHAVAYLRSGSMARHRGFATVTVARVTKRDVVLSNGERFRRDRYNDAFDYLSRSGQGSWAGWDYVRRLDDPETKRVEREAKVAVMQDRAFHAVRDLTDQGRQGFHDLGKVEAAIEALRAWKTFVEGGGLKG